MTTVRGGGKIGAGASALCAAAIFLAALGLERAARDRQAAFVEPPPDRAVAWDPNIVRILSFGHAPLVVDWLLIRFQVEDPSLFHVAPGRHPPGFFDLKLATQLDPAYAEAYLAGASILSIIRNDAPGAKELLLGGIDYIRNTLPGMPPEFRARYWRKTWQFWLMLAYIELFELQNMPAAADAFVQAASVEGSLTYLKALARRLQAPGGQYEVALSLIRNLLGGDRGGDLAPEMRETLAQQETSLRLQYFLWQVNQRFGAWRDKGAARGPGGSAPEQRLARFLAEAGLNGRDPLGGSLFLDPAGRIRTTTKFSPVMGLE